MPRLRLSAVLVAALLGGSALVRPAVAQPVEPPPLCSSTCAQGAIDVHGVALDFDDADCDGLPESGRLQRLHPAPGQGPERRL